MIKAFRRITVPPRLKQWLEFGVLALIIMLPLLPPGYVLTLDMVFTPHIAWPDITRHDFPLLALLWMLYQILPGDLVEKLVLFCILVASGAGMFLLIRAITRPAHISEDAWRLAAYVAGVFYMINPFIYARFMAGQWMILLGYALLPFFITALMTFLRQPSRHTSIIVVTWATLISIVSLHYIGMLLLVTIIFGAAMLFKHKNTTNKIQYLKWGALGVGLCLLLSMHWIAPLVIGDSELTKTVRGFDASHFAAFATLGWPQSVLQMQGFWVEARQLFILPQTITPLWGLFVITLWAIIVYGAIKAWRDGRKWLVVVSSACVLLAVLLSATFTIEWLASWLSFVAGYREPHKFVNLLVIGYAILLACGAAYTLEKVRQWHDWRRDAVMMALFLLPILITPTMFGGFAGQLSSRLYPSEWFEVNRMLKEDSSVKRILFLPWHQYANYSFSGRLIANPAEKFFQVPLLSSDDPEFKEISPTTPNEEKKQITQSLAKKELPPDLLKSAGITHIMLAKEQNWNDYKTLLKPEIIKLSYENAKIQIYEVRGNEKRP